MSKHLSIMLATLLLFGCSEKDEATSLNREQHPKVTEVKNTNIQNVDRKTGREAAQRLTNLATKVPLVNDATAVVIGRYAIVGIDIDEDIERSQVGTIKYSVGESLQNDPHGAYAIIVADPDLNERIREVAQDIENGQPIRGILNELADITSRVIPEVPGDTIIPQRMKTEEQPINEHEEKQLKRQQQKQSNGHLH